MVFRAPATASFATGGTFKLLVSEDTTQGYPTGKNVVLGVNIGLLGSSSAYKEGDTTNLGTEATVTLALPTTTSAGKTIEASIAMLVANMASAAANKWCIVRIRRLGANASDTSGNRLILHGVSILDT